ASDVCQINEVELTLSRITICACGSDKYQIQLAPPDSSLYDSLQIKLSENSNFLSENLVLN
ncbi:hypothetical protein, partial [Oenococcus kitaharae]|uniref:hypothetical protein n=1 Tax=Oenococcus kitaharae TaxID=336988 RepID=UPI001A7E0EC7